MTNERVDFRLNGTRVAMPAGSSWYLRLSDPHSVANRGTADRVHLVIDAAVKNRIALEISASFKLPKLSFLQIAKAAGVKFSFGSNGRFPKMGLLHYSIAMAKELGLRASDMFLPAPDGQKAVQRRA